MPLDLLLEDSSLLVDKDEKVLTVLFTCGLRDSRKGPTKGPSGG